MKNKANYKQERVLELIEEGFRGLNIVRFMDDFYALPQNKGNFMYNRLMAGKYPRIFCNKTLVAIKEDIIENRR